MYPSDKIARSHANNACKQNPEKMVKPIEKTSINVLKEKTSVVSASQTFQNLHTTALQSLVENIANTQLPGRLFSASDKSKKISHHFLLHFPIGMGSYNHHAKYQGGFMDLK